MKRTGNLFDEILDWHNLRLATAKALRGKRTRDDARRFCARLDERLAEMASQVADGTFPLGRATQFVIFDPKERRITAPCFAERVLHHAIMNVCEPYFERWLIDDSFACRVGRGRLTALWRAQQFAGRFGFFLKLDVRKYFDSVPHERLLARLGWRFKDERLLELFGRIVGEFHSAEAGRGLPIGSLTSQYLANFYLGWFDRFVKEQLRMPGYVRYMDDMVIWADSSEELRRTLTESARFLRDELSLELKPAYLNRMSHGLDVLGCRLYPQHMLLNRRSRDRLRRKLTALERRFEAGQIGTLELQQRATSVLAFSTTPGLSSWRFRQRVLQSLRVDC